MARIWLSLFLMGFVRFARYCGKIDSRHLFSYGVLIIHETSICSLSRIGNQWNQLKKFSVDLVLSFQELNKNPWIINLSFLGIWLSSISASFWLLLICLWLVLRGHWILHYSVYSAMKNQRNPAEIFYYKQCFPCFQTKSVKCVIFTGYFFRSHSFGRGRFGFYISGALFK